MVHRLHQPMPCCRPSTGIFSARRLSPDRVATPRATAISRKRRQADMQVTPTITFRGIDHSAALEAEIRTRIGKLETYYRAIIACRVLLELAERHHEIGNHYHVRIDLSVPGEEIVVTHDASLHATAQDLDADKATKQ